MKDIIEDYQAGFMAIKSLLDQIHVIKQITEKKSHELYRHKFTIQSFQGSM